MNIMKSIEKIDKMRIVSEAARHMKIHTSPIDRAWGSITCVSHTECVPPGWRMAPMAYLP